MISRRDEAVDLKKTGLNYAEIGHRLGISRERARQIIKGKPQPKAQARVCPYAYDGGGSSHAWGTSQYREALERKGNTKIMPYWSPR